MKRKNRKIDETRVTPLSLYLRGHAFWDAAQKLYDPKERAGLASEPVLTLWYHGIELTLKSFLRLHGVSIEKLEDLGHNLVKLANKAEKLGLPLTEEDHQVCKIARDNDAIIRARYPETGFYQRPSEEALINTGIRLIGEVHARLDQAGVFPKKRAPTS